jgi:hypothetical protein
MGSFSRSSSSSRLRCDSASLLITFFGDASTIFGLGLCRGEDKFPNTFRFICGRYSSSEESDTWNSTIFFNDEGVDGEVDGGGVENPLFSGTIDMPAPLDKDALEPEEGIENGFEHGAILTGDGARRAEEELIKPVAIRVLSLSTSSDFSKVIVSEFATLGRA